MAQIPSIGYLHTMLHTGDNEKITAIITEFYVSTSRDVCKLQTDEDSVLPRIHYGLCYIALTFGHKLPTMTLQRFTYSSQFPQFFPANEFTMIMSSIDTSPYRVSHQSLETELAIHQLI
ncbi:hypothetical protein CEXT_667831 [Caerostris extrusa]|uniref:Uncharacterized protein n=1 Tax=Caerostris extrusa TaxID=172846 RepID=A0AAV4SIU9_CAEEX|nr:hypothetical protein CEXT_667831 [Caerostris extrusa]